MTVMTETRMVDAISIKAGMSFEEEGKIWGVVAFLSWENTANGLRIGRWAIATEDGEVDELRLFTFDRLPIVGEVEWV